MRKRFPVLAAIIPALLSLASVGAGASKPNLLLVTIDTLRPDRLGCYGSPYLKTPAIDRVAAAGVVFDRAFAHTPLTLPSHTNILLGTTPLQHGVHDNGNFRVPDGLPTLAAFLKRNGYATAAFVGAFPLDSRFGLNRGFDVYDDHYGTGASLEYKFVERRAEAVVTAALGWLKDRPGPWFVWVHVFDPHQPYEPPQPYASRFASDLYSGEVAYADASLAALFDYVRASGQGGSTAIVITGDHGQSLGEHGETTHGYFAYNSTLRVPLIIAAPGIKPGRVAENACHIDIFPTACDLLGLDKPSFLQGASLLPALRGKAFAARPIYFESLYPYYRRGWAPQRGFIDGAKKFIDSPIPEVYDLKADPNETKNLAGKDLGRERAELAGLIQAESRGAVSVRPRLDAQAQRKLQSLGYVGGYQPPAKESFGPGDDLKTLLPFNRRFEEAQEAYGRGQVEESVALLRDLIAQRKDFDNPYLFLVTIYEQQGKLAEAEAVLKKGAEDNPRNYKLAIEYGIVLTEAGRNDEALAVLQKASGLIDWDPELWNYIGVAYYNKGDLEKALKAYEKALSLDPKYALVLANLGTVHFSLGMRDRDRESIRRAADYFQQAVEADPGYAGGYNGLGAIRSLSGDQEGAIQAWSKAVELDPDHRFALYNLGKAYLDQGDKAKALVLLKRYKDRYYRTLSAADRASLDADIARCR
jgi:arylsulfatase A-like enzyme/Flp pilus assembly protein TadD